MLTAHDIRKKFLDFFADKGHKIVASDSLVPKEDPTVLFTTAGMQQFKRQFLGQVDDFRRAATSQKCLRTDDLDQVGVTAFHHTFFEMLGNFSFGDYFKKDAILWAWEFLTGVIGIPKDKLWVSVYKDDKEAEDIWLSKVGIPADRLVRLGDKSNFWPADAKSKGPNGPCGPCSEIFYDYGVNLDCESEKCDPDCDCGRFSEVWNLVFTQFNRQEGGVLEPLPSKNIDTGMGLERLTAVVQGKTNNFDTDLFVPIRDDITRLAAKEGVELSVKETSVIADHIRAIVFAVNDGIIPSNKERGSVVKRLITESCNAGLNKGMTKPFVHKLVATVARVMKPAYPELEKQTQTIADMVKKVELAFIDVRKERIPELKEKVAALVAQSKKENLQPGLIDRLGGLFFLYYDTYGLPLATVADTVRSIEDLNDYDLDGARKVFEKKMTEQQERSRASSKMAGDVFTDAHLEIKSPKTIFTGYDGLSGEARVQEIFVNDQPSQQAKQGDQVKIVLDQSPFYAESGGQIGDQGLLTTGKGKVLVKDTQKIADVFLHIGTVENGTVSVREEAKTRVDVERRLSIMRNHTATHLLQAALREVLGPHVQQQGSVVDENRLRFDFSHPKALSSDEITKIEDSVFQRIMACDPVAKKVMSIKEARDSGALAFFGDKYGETVRVVTVGDYFKEFCAGTHLDNTGQIALLKIVGESAIAQGIRRIEAKTGTGALAHLREQEGQLETIARRLKTAKEDIPARIEKLEAQNKALLKELAGFRFDAARAELESVSEKAETLEGIKLIVHVMPNADISLLRKASDLLKAKHAGVFVVLGSTVDDNAYLLAAASADAVKKGLKANECIARAAILIGGRGGGKPQLAQAGSKDPSKINEALKAAGDWAKAILLKSG